MWVCQAWPPGVVTLVRSLQMAGSGFPLGPIQGRRVAFDYDVLDAQVRLVTVGAERGEDLDDLAVGLPRAGLLVFGVDPRLAVSPASLLRAR
jgi:hypothetical protein